MFKASRPAFSGFSILLSGVLLLTLAGVLVARSNAAGPDKASATAARPALTVSITRPEAREWPLILVANGNIAAWQEAVVGAEANGLQMTEILVNVGDRVRKGELLARLQDNTLTAELAQSKASLQEAQATLAEAAANAERGRQLKASGAMSAQQVSQFMTGEQTAKARVAVLEARIKADAIRLAQTRVLAPDNGTISVRLATLGAVVQPGQELFRLIRRDRLEWRAEVPSADLPRLKPGQPVTVFTAGGAPVAGKIRMLAPTVDPQTRNGLVYVDLAQPGAARDSATAYAPAQARAGMFARGEFELGTAGALTLPQSAVQLRDGFHYVYRVGDDSKVTQSKVSIGRREGERIEITEGLEADQRVVQSGVGFLADGDTVRVVEPPASGKPMTDKPS